MLKGGGVADEDLWIMARTPLREKAIVPICGAERVEPEDAPQPILEPSPCSDMIATVSVGTPEVRAGGPPVNVHPGYVAELIGDHPSIVIEILVENDGHARRTSAC